MKVIKNEIVTVLKCARENNAIAECQNFIARKARRVLSDDEEKILEISLVNFQKKFKEKWKSAWRSSAKFQAQNQEWLETEFELPRSLKSHKIPDETSEPPKKKGRQEKKFVDKGERAQQIASKKVRESSGNQPFLLLKAAQQSAQSSGTNELASDIKVLLNKSTKENEKQIRPMTSQEALAFILDLRLSVRSYNRIRLESKSRGADIFPAYKKVVIEKKNCRPPEIISTPTFASVPLQNLLDHSAARIVESQKQLIEISMENKSSAAARLNLICNWGCDGSSDQSQYHQSFVNAGEDSCDSNLFATTLIPLRLHSNDEIIWTNKYPQSVNFCRPIKLEYVKESKSHTQKLKKEIDDQIQALESKVIKLDDGKAVEISYQLCCTAVDVFNLACESSDPLISILRSKERKEEFDPSKLSLDIQQLLESYGKSIGNNENVAEIDELDDVTEEFQLDLDLAE
jgi:hypothetical protein